MKPVLLMDFGSTYTKVTAVDVDSETLLGTASSYTTVQTDIGEGLQNALNILEQKTGKLDFSESVPVLCGRGCWRSPAADTRASPPKLQSRLLLALGPRLSGSIPMN